MLLLGIITVPIAAKNNPTILISRLIARKRAKSLDNGVNVSLVEQTREKDVLTKNGLKNAEFELLKGPGCKSIRLPVAFEYFK